MFQKAYSIAAEFTRPVIFSRLQFDGTCSSSLSAFVVINSDGWIVTASHIIEHWRSLIEGCGKARDREKRVIEIEANESLDYKEKAVQKKSLGKPKPSDSDRCSAVWGAFPGNPCLTQMAYLPAVDLGIGKLEPYDPAWTKNYPVFKDPKENFMPEVSLCKLGYPLHNVVTKYNSGSDRFELPKNTFPLPRFPMDGMYTRNMVILPAAGGSQPFPFICIETSTPGLKGQSGGPTFDKEGTIWAIQCKTSTYTLGFTDIKPEQFLHVGIGVHPITMFGLFDQFGIKYQVSKY